MPHSVKSLWAESPWNLNPQAELSSCTLAELSQEAKGVRRQAATPMATNLIASTFFP